MTTTFDHDKYDAAPAEELGRMILSWAKIPPGDVDAIAQFIEAVQNSSIPDAARDFGHAVKGGR